MINKKIFLRALFAAAFGAIFSASPEISAVTFDTKSIITVSATPFEKITEIEKKSGKTEYNQKNQFGGSYVQNDFALSNDKITVGTKIRYCITSSAFSSDSVSQKIDLKRAFARYRPFSSNLLEFSIGKLYSYYLSGNFFSIAEHYTGASRWGKTGVGAKFEHGGFLLGAAIQATESSKEFSDYFGISGALSYDFSNLNKKIPLKLGADLNFIRTGADYSSTDSITDGADYDFSECVSLYYTPKTDGFISKLALALSYSRNSEPYVSSSVYKKIANYSNSDIKKSQFVSWNYRSNFGAVQLVAEGEAGHSISGNMIPIYAGAQLLIPIYQKNVYFKPRFSYFAGIDSADSKNSRNSFEIYPRAWITAGKYTFSAGANILHKEYKKDFWKWEWEIPLFVQYKV